MSNEATGMFINFVLSMLLKKIVVPSGYHPRVKAVRQMLEDDVTGLIDSLTDFAVNTSTVDFGVETDNSEFTKKLKIWLDNINSKYNGQIPRGIKALAKEYFKERWKSSSFPVLKITEWDTVEGLLLPTKMFFVDGGSIYAKDITKDDENIKKLINYDYYLGSKLEEDSKLDRGVIITRPFGRWFDKYPVPYLIKRGIYHNYQIIKSLKNKQSELLEQVIPYLLLIKKGTEGLATSGTKVYSNEELKQTIQEFQNLMDEMKSTKLTEKQVKSPIRASQFDEDIKHLIPDLSALFNRDLFVIAERNILSGLGFIDVVEATSTSRRESILNPKAFIQECKSGVEDFKQIVNELIALIIEKNKNHRKYVNTNFYITSAPIVGFMTDDFKSMIRSLYDRGRISSQTAVELIGEVDFRTEVHRRDKESAEGIEETMYPPITQNREGEGIDLPSDFGPDGETEEEKEDENKTGPEKENFDQSNLEGAPYQTIKDLPSSVRKNLSPNLQSVFLRVFNQAYDKYKNDSRAFRIAWGVIKKIAKKNKTGKWVRKGSKTKLNKAILEEVLEKEEQKIIDETIKAKKLEIANQQSELLGKLLGKSKE